MNWFRRLLGGRPERQTQHQQVAKKQEPVERKPPEAAAKKGEQILIAIEKTSGIMQLLGDGRFETDVVGESHYQREIEAAVGGRTTDGANDIIQAELILENENAYDDQAVKVMVQGRTVGYLSREKARWFRALLASEEIPPVNGTSVGCAARVRGGWDRGAGDRGHFGIKLDLLG